MTIVKFRKVKWSIKKWEIFRMEQTKQHQNMIKNWVKVNDRSRGICNVGHEIKFRTMMLKSKLCDYSDKYILVKGNETITGQ